MSFGLSAVWALQIRLSPGTTRIAAYTSATYSDTRDLTLLSRALPRGVY